MMQIPLVDLGWQVREIEEEVKRGWSDVLSKTAFIGGAAVAGFEQAFASYTGVRHVVGVANGTDALEMILRAVGIGLGDEVIVPANSFIASALAVARAGAKPVLVDCDPVYHLLDPDRIASAITARTRAIIPVHLYGQIAPMESIRAIAEKHSLLVIEDAAQSQGAMRHGRMAGFGVAAATSFYPGKNLGAYGDAGAILTNDDEIARKARALRNYGSDIRYHHPETGFNSRLDTLQAVVLSAKVPRLDAWNDLRRRAAEIYRQLLENVPGVSLPSEMAGNKHVWHLFVVELDNRDHILAGLQARGVAAAIHYPCPIHLQGAFAHLGYKAGEFPVAEHSSMRIVSLPIYPGITLDQQRFVAAQIRAVLRT